MTWPNYLRNEVVVDGRRTSLTKQQAAIVATLLINRGKPVRYPDLIEAVWPDPDLEPEGAEGVLEVQFVRLRRKIPGVVMLHGCRTGWWIPARSTVSVIATDAC